MSCDELFGSTVNDMGRSLIKSVDIDGVDFASDEIDAEVIVIPLKRRIGLWVVKSKNKFKFYFFF